MTDPAPSTDIAALREAATKASALPWENDDTEIYVADSWDDEGNRTWVGETCDIDDYAKGSANGALIVAAVNALPALLDEVERLQADNERQARTIAYLQRRLDREMVASPPVAGLKPKP